MSDSTRDANKAARATTATTATTVLDPLRPAVVVRRRVYDATLLEKGADAPRTFVSATLPPVAPTAPAFHERTSYQRTSYDPTSHDPTSHDPTSHERPSHEPTSHDDDENGPPSSINVARALASLRADELQRVEELVRADEEGEDEDDRDDGAESVAEPSIVAPPPAPAVPTVRLGKTVSLAELAQKIGVPARELPATLVARGFYELTAKTVLPRETARAVAEMFGWHVEDATEQEESLPVKSGTRARVPSSSKVKAAAAVAKAAKTKVAKRRAAR